jgi:hypothetical protein
MVFQNRDKLLTAITNGMPYPKIITEIWPLYTKTITASYRGQRGFDEILVAVAVTGRTT